LIPQGLVRIEIFGIFCHICLVLPISFGDVNFRGAFEVCGHCWWWCRRCKILVSNAPGLVVIGGNDRCKEVVDAVASCQVDWCGVGIQLDVGGEDGCELRFGVYCTNQGQHRKRKKICKLVEGDVIVVDCSVFVF
jgi:hypothetical protein